MRKQRRWHLRRVPRTAVIRKMGISADDQRRVRESPQPLARVAAARRAKVWAFLVRAWRRYSDAEISTRSASVTYYTVLSLFPLLITVGNLLPLFGLSYNNISQYLVQVVPARIMTWLNPIIKSLLTSTSGSVLSVGAIATLWTASLGITELKNGFNRVYGVKPAQNFIIKRLVSMLLLLTLVVVMGAVLLAFTFGNQFLEWLIPLLGLDDTWIRAFNDWRWPVTVVAIVVVIVIADYALSNVKIKLRFVLPGAAFSVVTLLAVAQLFTLYMRYFGTRYSSYGTIGTVMVLMLWLDLSAMLLIIGALINATVAEYFLGRPHQARGKVYDLVDHQRRELR
ncbi:ribonuclease BN-like family protein [Lacticaseibacillus thailandensis DSM 22698 = JCM 13996]|uniref:Ribonuclease BN-like family protein n=2 Tax=Lacticaseibacillus thailandensis TaxID=381741 RepID=A0A0R2C830_9LACO|nr:YihY/virulence factor BrkB family protein [Lacticaseibacillus thailandensis]KRM87397.1 ribonuclease BN-like family protein [Lacticaseibacillus thailandensis DSM 22698 = JCM 13996]